MPNPTLSDLHVDRPLTNVSIAYSQAGKFAARSIFPVIPVTNKSNTYFEYDKADWLRPQAKKRAAGAESPVGGWRVSEGTFNCERFSLSHDVSDPERANADPAINLDVEAAEYVTENVELTLEDQWASDFFTTGTWNGASSSTDMTGQAAPASTSSNFKQWNNVDATPIEDIRAEAREIEENTGYFPNKLILGPRVYDALQDHPDILDRIKYSGKGIVTPELIAQLVGVDQVVVLRATKNTAAEGASASYSFIAGKAALLCYSNPSPGLRKPTAGYSFVWTANGTPVQGLKISRVRLDRNESDRITGETWIDFRKVAGGLGAFFTSAVA